MKAGMTPAANKEHRDVEEHEFHPSRRLHLR
jgi:hypothetical protein